MSTNFLPTDIVILVTGLVGSGRSTFINALLPESSQKMAVSGSLSTCTKKVEYAVVDLSASAQCKRDCRLVLVDTPGFNDSEKSDSVILSEITSWIQRSLPDASGRCRGGVIYLHDISGDRIQGTAESDLQALDAAFNAGSSQHLIIATTKWNCINNDEGERRHELLKGRWMQLSAGSKVHKFKQDADAWNIISEFLPQIERGTPIDLRKELGGMQDKKEKGERSPNGKREVAFRTLARLFSRILTAA